VRTSYVMIYSSALAQAHKTLTTILDELDPACDWHAPMPHCLLFTSLLTASQLAQHFEGKLGVGPGKLFLISAASSNKQGRLTERGWRILNNPENPRGT